MAGHRDFAGQLENFRREAEAVAQYVYADMSVQHAASKSRKLLNRLNRTPGFWLVHGAACQAAAYVALGRVFDKTSKYNIGALLDAYEASQATFSRSALATRKRDGQLADPSWLPDYLDRAYYPTKSDAQYLRRRVETYRAIFDRAIKPARNKYLAHRERVGHVPVQALFSRGMVRDIWRLSTFLLALHEALWQLFHNGRKPVLRKVRYSVKTIYDSESQGTSPHEYITGQTKKLLKFLASATPNNTLERAVRHRGPRLAAARSSVPAAQLNR